ncbi:LPS export ABC transporter permease LptF/LPS export ABC transporter permease LptG [Granulicella aggregans]|uniref:LPS export ABC transporter permease LptF/LPS export ABC transporter permease LptG n=1 Tax=Granulicella aggregans TaxID=474949 RepID=A0A7W7ZKG1_9BACT|nr:LptF/LptG family permease [Granulicella aggregans]MBB5061522.1 LPS export ABC transporter permease LptF/LPS export ABC transporter permease LptG [Granulicella aggregans]
MRILTRYILREVLSYAILGGVMFTFILFTARLGSIFETFVRGSASFTDVSLLIAYFLPDVLVVTIPMAVLVGILLGLSRLAADSEITAMRAAGMGALDFVRIVSLVSFAAVLLGLFNSFYLEPHAASSLLKLEDRLKYAQVSFEVEPRVFDEDFKNTILYVQDVVPGNGAALWHHVFIADLTQPANPLVKTAEQAIVTTEGPGDLHLLLKDGGQYQVSDANPNTDNIERFTTADIPIQSGAQNDTHISRSNTRYEALPLSELRRKIALGNADPAARIAARPYRIELNKRFSYPFACLVLMLVGVPLGLWSKRGGKSAGFVLTILLVFTYYLISSIGVALATQGKLPALVGVWGANLLFTVAGLILLQQMSVGGLALSVVSSIGLTLSNVFRKLRPGSSKTAESVEEAKEPTRSLAQRFRSSLHIQFPLILDEYIMRAFISNFALVLITFWILFTIFTFFELIGDIIRNRTPLVTVGDYLLNLIPYILYNVTPLCVLVAVLITFGALSRSSELTAMKAAGISLYRILIPVVVLAAVIACSLFAFDEFYLPAANRRQEALRNTIKGKPAQTFLRPDRKWISGQLPTDQGRHAVLTNFSGSRQAPPQARAVEPVRIFYYQFFDSDRNVFANLTVFELDPATFTLQRRIFAASARWDGRVDRWLFESGWVRTFSGKSLASYQPFVLTTFPQIKEEPQYFKKEDRQSQEMSFGELSSYISDLRQSGFDTKRLSVQLDRKLAYPATAFVMAIIGMPFAFSTGKRGGVAGFAAAIGIAVVYMGTDRLFEAMGNVSALPPSLAAGAPDLLFAIVGSYLLLRTPT